MRNLIKIKNLAFTLFAIVFLLGFSNELLADPEVKAIERYKPTDQYVSESEIYWIVYYTEPINGKTMDIDDYKLSVVSGKFSGEQYVFDYWQNDKSGYEWIVGATEVYSEDGTIRLDFVGYVENTKGAGTSKGYSFTKGDTYIYGEGGGGGNAPEVTTINRFNPGQQNNLNRDLTWYVAFSSPIITETISTDDFKVITASGNVTGTISGIEEMGNQEFLVNVTEVSGTGNIRLDFTGTVTGEEDDDSEKKYTNGEIYTILSPVSVTSINRFNPTEQQVKANSVQWRVVFSRSVTAGTVSAADFKMTATNGTLTGSVTSVSGTGTTYTITASGINKDATLRLDFVGNVNDTYNLPSSGTFTTGQTYILDFTAPKLQEVTINGNGQKPGEVNPEQTVTVNFKTDEPLYIVSSYINGKPVFGSGDGSTIGKISYTFSKLDEEGPITFEITVRDFAGNMTTFTETTDGSMLNFLIPPPNALIITQPVDVIECEGSLDQYLFVVAAPDQKGLQIAYRWWKDGKPYSSWVEDFGQITFDTLEYGMSGTYMAELFVFDPNYTEEEEDNEGSKFNPGGVGNGEQYSYEEARVSPIVFSAPANLYVLQRPSFMSNIKNVTANEGVDVSITFDANIYGEHNMDDPTYWTQIQWYRGDDALVDDERYEGTQSSILTINDLMTTDYADNYRVRLIGNCDTIWSNNFAISSEPMANITTQPLNAEGCLNDKVQFLVDAEATQAGVLLAYQWTVDGVNIVDEANKFSGANTSTLEVTLNPALGYDGTEEFVCVISPIGFPDNTVSSDPVMITWKMPPVITVDLMNDYSEEEGNSLELYITADGSNLSYTWTKDGADLGVDNDTLSLTDLALADAGQYTVTVTNECGDAVSRVSTVVVTQGPVITNIPLEDRIGLHQNYPNPFGESTTISWNSQAGGYATMIITDMLGNKVATIFEKNINAGFDKVSINSSELNLSSGTYYLTFRLNNTVQTRQITIVK